MPLSAKTVRTQLTLLKPIINGCSLKTIRRGQNKIGEIMESRHRDGVVIKKHKFNNFEGAWAIPKDERRGGVILYLHGGGYTCGDLEYATGFGSMLASRCGARVFCAAYRLAPENKYPAALEDALEAYTYLLDKGYASENIVLCGESAGGGLCYSLCLKLRETGSHMPGGIVALSPWTDLTASGSSYSENMEADPTMSEELLRFFANSYTEDKKDPLVSPLFADLRELPPSLIFVGGDEIMLSDSTEMHRRLEEAGVKSKIVIKPERWHGYLLYGLTEDARDFKEIERFLNAHMSKERKLMWMRLDNAAKIYPAARREGWSNLFRLSATLKEDVDREVLSSALDITARRFPSISVRLRRGMFWYYLEQLSDVPRIMDESSYPLTVMSKEETSQCAYRIIVYKRRIAVEVFHSLTDGTGALIFLKSLVAEYLQQKYGVYIPSGNGVLARLEEPSPEELEDSFQKHAGAVAASRRERTAWHLSGTPESSGRLNVTCLTLPVKAALDKAHEYGVSLNTYLVAVMMKALLELQAEKVRNVSNRKPIKVLVPVNLRPLYNSRSLRNFALYTTPEILASLGDYSISEICSVVSHHMGLEVTPKQMSMKIATNINSERLMAVRVMPLFIKNMVMKAVFDTVGEKKSCLTLSNLGAVKLPDEMKPYIERFDFILGSQASAPYNCGAISFGDELNINFIRNIKEAELERKFYSVLRTEGLSALVQSNLP